MRVMLQPIFILHTRPFSDTSLIIKLFSPEFGKVDLIARNARGPRSRFRGMLLPFIPFLASWSGNTDLKSLSQIENNGLPLQLQGKALVCGLYLNELLMRLIPNDDPHPQIFSAYQTTLSQLQENKKLEIILRNFEKELITALGYGLELQKDTHGNKIIAENYYQYLPEIGFLKIDPNNENETIFSGKHLLAFAEDDLSNAETLHAAKYLMRLALNPLLGDKPIKTRELL